jgi:hypothetical protein
MPDWAKTLRKWIGKDKSASGPEMYRFLRAIPLELDLATIHAPAGEPWSGAAVAMMEIGMAKGVASFAAIADGSVSMYLSVGGGVIGAGSHAAVRAAADQFRIAASDSRVLLQRTADFPLPEPGQVRFQARTVEGGFTGAAAEQALRTGRHPLSSLYASGQDLVTEIRLSTPETAFRAD